MLEGKVAVITGGSRGLGKAIALEFAAQRASLVLVAQHSDRLEEVHNQAKSLGAQSVAILGDVACREFCRSTVDSTLQTFGRVDILVNNAGTISREPFEELDFKAWQRVIDVNLNGAFHFCQAVLPTMKAQNGGRIINMTSQMASIPHPSAAPSYEVSKAGLTALTRHLAYHYAQYAISVNAIAPGSIDTDMPRSMTPEARERLKQAIPVKRLGLPEEVAKLALFLASDSAGYITGATLPINGGSLMD